MQISLVDYMAFLSGLFYVSDLKDPSLRNDAKLARILEALPPEAESLFGWNDALEYLFNEPPAQTQEEARARLIAKLRS